MLAQGSVKGFGQVSSEMNMNQRGVLIPPGKSNGDLQRASGDSGVTQRKDSNSPKLMFSKLVHQPFLLLLNARLSFFGPGMMNIEVTNDLSLIVCGDKHDRGITNKFNSLQVPGNGEIQIHDGNLSMSGMPS
jgi:hypothetical protein